MDTSTTVEVKKGTAKILEELKRKYQARSIDETVRRLISKAENIPDSMFGAHSDMRPFTKRDEPKDHEL
jgi:hypothetical protein